MQETLRRNRTRRGLWGPLGLSALCLAVSGGYALAQQKPPKPEAQVTSDAKPETNPKAPAKTTPRAEPPKAETKTGPATPVLTGPSTGTTATKATRPSAAAARSKRAGPKAKPTTPRKGARTGRTGRRPTTRPAKRKHPFDLDENAHWKCEREIVSAKPVWRGDKNLRFRFDILNEGTAPLKMKGKGS